MCMLIADDLITAYNEGFSCEDGSIPHGSPGRHFQCKVSLLYVTGDYPALAILTGYTHSGNLHCHWCMQDSKKDMSIGRHNCGGFRRWLPIDSRHRAGGGNFRTEEYATAPPFRNHADTEYVSVLANDWAGPVRTTGLDRWRSFKWPIDNKLSLPVYEYTVAALVSIYTQQLCVILSGCVLVAIRNWLCIIHNAK